MKLKLDWFLTGMALAIGLAWLMPDPGAKGGALHPELLNKAGVALIFFLNGLGLSFAALKAGTLRWPLHLLVQTSTFVLFPLLGLLALWTAGDHLPADLRLGFFYLSIPDARICSRWKLGQSCWRRPRVPTWRSTWAPMRTSSFQT